MSERFDLSALREPVDEEHAVAEAAARIAREGRGVEVRRATVWNVLQTVVLVPLVGVLALLVLTVVYLLADGQYGVAGLIPIAAVMVLPLAVSRVRSHLAVRRDLELDVYRLGRFAAANDLTHVIAEYEPERPGALFHAGSSRTAMHVMSSQTPRTFAVGDYYYETWVARGRMPYEAVFASFAVSRSLPAMTITPRGGPPANGWRAPVEQKKLALDGVFEKRAEVRCDPSLADEVETVLTPTVQAALLDVAERADVEFVDGTVLVSVRRYLALTDPVFWEWVEELGRFVALVESTDPRQEWEPVEQSRRSRMEALRAGTGAGRTIMIGCLLPLVFGVGATLLVAFLSH